MNVQFNPRENGACPLCSKMDRCSIREKIRSTLQDVRDLKGLGLEMVIYLCPSFIEKH